MGQDIFLFILVIMVVAIAVMAYFLSRRKLGEKFKEDNQAILMIQDQLKEMRQTLQNFGSQVD
ncbi:MAG: hypothetical protein NTV77_01635, partial [Candidatus Azambacteria bacterium]|nr:hypothetical protein [Candidatus Azambacteria bacterium]